MSKKRFEKEQAVADSTIVSLSDSINDQAKRHAETIASMRVRHLKEINDIKKHEHEVVQETLKHLRPVTIMGHRSETQPVFIVQSVINLSGCQWMDTARDCEYVTETIIHDLCDQLAEQLRVMARGRGLGEFMLQVEQQDLMRKQKKLEYKRQLEWTMDPTHDSEPRNDCKPL